jgi:hypothetical protein
MSKLKHIEVEGCIVNIRTGLFDSKGRKVTSIEILPDDHFAGERIWRLSGYTNNRVIQLKKTL